MSVDLLLLVIAFITCEMLLFQTMSCFHCYVSDNRSKACNVNELSSCSDVINQNNLSTFDCESSEFFKK